jgi:hypothetical protein
MDPGDGLYSLEPAARRTQTGDQPRQTLICCYNARHNDPYKPSHHPGYTPLSKVADATIRQMAGKTSAAAQQFLDPKDDQTTGAGKENS